MDSKAEQIAEQLLDYFAYELGADKKWLDFDTITKSYQFSFHFNLDGRQYGLSHHIDATHHLSDETDAWIYAEYSLMDMKRAKAAFLAEEE
jgi:hypothetical protein